MTTRKELIERIQAMQLGTQEMLDAAANDATLIPFDTLFVDESGNPVCRVRHCGGADHKDYVWLATVFDDQNCYAPWELRPMSED